MQSVTRETTDIFRVLRRHPCPELLLALVFLLVGVCAILSTRANDGVALIWPGNALVAATLIRYRHLHWPTTAVAVLLACVLANRFAGGDSWALALGLGAVNLVEIALSVTMFRYLFRLPLPHITILQALQMTLLMGGVNTGIAALLGGLLLHGAVGAPLWPTVHQWWETGALSACLLAPAIVLFSRSALRRVAAPGYLAGNALTLLACVLATYLAIRHVSFPFVVMSLVPMMAAFKVGGFGAAILGLACGVTVIALWSAGIQPAGLLFERYDTSLVHFPFIAVVATIMPPMAVGLGTDARRRAARALASSERRFRETMEHSPVGMVLLDLAGRWVYANPAMEKMLGYTRKQLSRLTIDSLAHPEELADIRNSAHRLLSQQIESYAATRRYHHSDGTWIWVHCAVSLARDDDGDPLHFIGHIESMEERRQAEAHVAAERELLRITLASIGDAVLTTDGGGRVTYLNGAASTLLAQPAEALRGRPVQEILRFSHAESGQPAPDVVEYVLAHRTRAERAEPAMLERSDGSTLPATEIASPVLDADGNLTGIVIVVHDMSASVAQAQALQHRADHDPLTGLKNRAGLQRQLGQALARLRQHGTHATLIAIDLDRFKAVNDRGGHAAGDAVLRSVADALRTAVRPSDHIGRPGGDEFMVLLLDCPPAHGEEVACRIHTALNPLETHWQGEAFATGASMGVAHADLRFDAVEDWLAAADTAAYDAKRSGRGAVRLWRGDHAATTLRLQQLSLDSPGD